MKNYERDDVRAFVIGEMWDDLRRLGFSGFLNDLGDWLNAEDIVTNRDKFKEVFGAEALDHTWSGVCSQICPKICPDCTSCEYSFWNKEYHEPNAGEKEKSNV